MRDFENLCNEWIATLVQEGTILVGYLTGVDENLRRSRGYFTFLEEGVAVEKKVMIVETGEQLSFLLLVTPEI